MLKAFHIQNSLEHSKSWSGINHSFFSSIKVTLLIFFQMCTNKQKMFIIMSKDIQKHMIHIFRSRSFWKCFSFSLTCKSWWDKRWVLCCTFWNAWTRKGQQVSWLEPWRNAQTTLVFKRSIFPFIYNPNLVVASKSWTPITTNWQVHT